MSPTSLRTTPATAQQVYGYTRPQRSAVAIVGSLGFPQSLDFIVGENQLFLQPGGNINVCQDTVHDIYTD